MTGKQIYHQMGDYLRPLKSMDGVPTNVERIEFSENGVKFILKEDNNE